MKTFDAQKKQFGASLIEVLVSILILSLGSLALAHALASSIQLPKLSLYRSLAINIAHNYIERIRANPLAFQSGNYDTDISYDGAYTVPEVVDCVYPNCDSTSLATMDSAMTKRLLRQQLPAGGLRLDRLDPNGNKHSTQGNLWIIWQEPNSTASFQSLGTSDDCPKIVQVQFSNAMPRCIFIRFRL
jgi:type IV pilus assembly protein PilV